jgi:hypothetical protein
MKVTNLGPLPVKLDDGRVIGAFGTPEDTREYDAAKLSPRDHARVNRNELAVVVEDEPKPKAPPTPDAADAKGKK